MERSAASAEKIFVVVFSSRDFQSVTDESNFKLSPPRESRDPMTENDSVAIV